MHLSPFRTEIPDLSKDPALHTHRESCSRLFIFSLTPFLCQSGTNKPANQPTLLATVPDPTQHAAYLVRAAAVPHKLFFSFCFSPWLAPGRRPDQTRTWGSVSHVESTLLASPQAPPNSWYDVGQASTSRGEEALRPASPHHSSHCFSFWFVDGVNCCTRNGNADTG